MRPDAVSSPTVNTTSGLDAPSSATVAPTARRGHGSSSLICTPAVPALVLTVALAGVRSPTVNSSKYSSRLSSVMAASNFADSSPGSISSVWPLCAP